jgi:Helix-turn-helix domain/RodZ C-terminal domain
MFEIGSSLHEARTRQDFGFEEMEARTKVRAKYLRLLEEERFEQLPGHTYTKGFLRAYADALGLDGQLYVDEYNSRHVAGDEDYAPKTRRVTQPRSRRSARRESHLVAVALVGILLVTALVIAAWRFGGSDTPQVQGVNAAGAPAGTATTTQRITLQVRAAKGPSYLEVRVGSPSGAPLYSGTLERGRTQTFKRKALYLQVRKPKNVVVKVNGNRYPLSSSGELMIAAATGGG